MKNKIRKLFTFTCASISLGVCALLGVSLVEKESAPIIDIQATTGNYNTDPSTFYQSIDNGNYTGRTLLGKLHDLLCDTHKTYTSYSACKNPTIVNSTDYFTKGDTSSIRDFYSQTEMSSSWGSGNAGTWNREHVWPQNLSNGLYGTDNAGGDIHHIRPVESRLNGLRSNHPFGICPDHAKNKAHPDDSNDQPITSILGGWDDGTVFEPIDSAKGDTARIVMYMYTHYNRAENVNGTKNPTSNGKSVTGNMAITNIIDESSIDKCFGLLLKWNESDPVDQYEIDRNNMCAKYTGTRNPFIDNPSYATAIWGNGAIEPPTPVDPEPSDPTPGDTNSVTYTIESTSSVSSTDAPSGTSASFINTFTTKDQIIKDNSMTLTLSGYSGYKIKGVELNAHSNARKGNGGLSLTLGNTHHVLIEDGTPFSEWPGSNGFTTTWTKIIASLSQITEVGSNEDIKIEITCSTNSIYCNNIKVLFDVAEKPSVVPVESISLNAKNKELIVGDTFELVPIILPSDATNKNVRYESDNVTICSVSSNGLIEALKEGNANISVITEDGSKKDTIAVSVKAEPIVPPTPTPVEPIKGDGAFVTLDFTTVEGTHGITTDDVWTYIEDPDSLIKYFSTTNLYRNTASLRIGTDNKVGELAFTLNIPATSVEMKVKKWFNDASVIDVNGQAYTLGSNYEVKTFNFTQDATDVLIKSSSKRVLVEYIKIYNKDYSSAFDFTKNFMHLEDYDGSSNLGYCNDSTHNYYGIAKEEFNSLTDKARLYFSTLNSYKNGYQRFVSWGYYGAKEEVKVDNAGKVTYAPLNKSNMVIDVESNGDLIVLVSLISFNLILISAFGFYKIKRFKSK